MGKEQDEKTLEAICERSIEFYYKPVEIGPYTKYLFNRLKRYLPLIDKNGKLYNYDGSEVTYGQTGI